MAIPVGAPHNSPGPVGQAKVVSTTTSPAADVTFDPPSRRILVGAAGDLAVNMAFDTASIVISSVPIGLHEFQVKTIYSTGTTAKGITGFW